MQPLSKIKIKPMSWTVYEWKLYEIYQDDMQLAIDFCKSGHMTEPWMDALRQLLRRFEMRVELDDLLAHHKRKAYEYAAQAEYHASVAGLPVSLYNASRTAANPRAPVTRRPRVIRIRNCSQEQKASSSLES